MANGKTAHEHIGAVKSTVDSLEISPSHRSATSPIQGMGGHGTRAVAYGAHSEHTSKLSHGSSRGKPRGTKTHIGKKDLMYHKSRGR
jgi:hypothetical protein